MSIATDFLPSANSPNYCPSWTNCASSTDDRCGKGNRISQGWSDWRNRKCDRWSSLPHRQSDRGRYRSCREISISIVRSAHRVITSHWSGNITSVNCSNSARNWAWSRCAGMRLTANSPDDRSSWSRQSCNSSYVSCES